MSACRLPALDPHFCRTACRCCQTDEDITSLDMTILMACKEKVNQSYIMIILATFDELMLRHDVCSLSFSEIHTWIKKSARHTWKAWRNKEVDWGPSPSVPHILHQATTSLWAQRWKEIKSNTFWRLDSDCRKASTCDGCHGCIRTRIGPFKYFMESLSSLLFNRSDLTSASIRSRPQSSILCRHVFCPRIVLCRHVRSRPQIVFAGAL